MNRKVLGRVSNSVVFGVAVSMLAAACSRGQADKASRPTVEARKAFTIDIPAGCAMTGGDRRIDFAILAVSCGKVEGAGIYAGNDPNIDQSHEGLALRADIPDREIIVGAKDPDEQVRGYLWQTQYDWPSRLHVWIVQGRERDEVARRIAASVAPSDPNSLTETDDRR
jgi:hypothetical protein